MTELLRSNVPHQVSRGVRVAVRVTVETSYTAARPLRASVFGLVELLLRKRCEQQTQTLKLLGVQNPVEKFVVIFDGDKLALRNIPEVRPGRQVDRGRKFRKKVIGQVKFDVETG